MRSEKSFKVEILDIIFKKSIFKKYFQDNKTAGALRVQLENRMETFSWGDFYLMIHSLEQEINVEDIYTAAHIEMLCWSSKILDDVLDDDVQQILDDKNSLLLFTDVLMEAMTALSHHENFKNGIGHVQKAISGQWHDVNRTLLKSFVGEKEYYHDIVIKTTSIIEFICVLANSNQPEIWKQFSYHYGVSLQLNNDIKGIYLESKGDLANFSPTLPLIKFFEQEYEKKVQAIEAGASLKKLRKLILDSGAIEYCHFIIETEKKEGRKLLSYYFPKQELQIEQIFAALPR